MSKAEKGSSQPRTETKDPVELAKRLAGNIRLLMAAGRVIDSSVHIEIGSKHFVSNKVLGDRAQHELNKLNMELSETLCYYGVDKISEEVREQIGLLAKKKNIADNPDLKLN